jgi:hypothetical protein
MEAEKKNLEVIILTKDCRVGDEKYNSLLKWLNGSENSSWQYMHVCQSIPRQLGCMLKKYACVGNQPIMMYAQILIMYQLEAYISSRC